MSQTLVSTPIGQKFTRHPAKYTYSTKPKQVLAEEVASETVLEPRPLKGPPPPNLTFQSQQAIPPVSHPDLY
jgi:hypothetical protein